MKHLADNPQTTLLEGLHSVAYQGGLGRPLIVPDGCLGGLNAGERASSAARLRRACRSVGTGSAGLGLQCSLAGRPWQGAALGSSALGPLLALTRARPIPIPADVAADFYAAHYTAPRMVLAGAGVAHDELVRLAEPLLAAAPRGATAGEFPSKYIGGDWRCVRAPPPAGAALLVCPTRSSGAVGWRVACRRCRGCHCSDRRCRPSRHATDPSKAVRPNPLPPAPLPCLRSRAQAVCGVAADARHPGV